MALREIHGGTRGNPDWDSEFKLEMYSKLQLFASDGTDSQLFGIIPVFLIERGSIGHWFLGSEGKLET